MPGGALEEIKLVGPEGIKGDHDMEGEQRGESLGDMDRIRGRYGVQVTIRSRNKQIWTKAELDTGTSSAWMDARLFAKMGGEVIESQVLAHGADGSKLRVVGEAREELGINLWGRNMRLRVKLIDPLPAKLLLGCQCMENWGMVLDLSQKPPFGYFRGSPGGGALRPRVQSPGSELIASVDELLSIRDQISTLDLCGFSDRTPWVEQLRKALNDHADVFCASGATELVEISGVSHKISITKGADPYVAPMRRRSPAEENIEAEAVRSMLNRGILEPATSPWAAVNVFVPKRNGKTRVTTDFRRLNAVTIPDGYPPDNMAAVLTWLGTKRIFSTLDLVDAFWQVPLDPDSRDYTAVRTVLGLFRYTRMPQGLRNSPATLQRVIHGVFGDMRGRELTSFMDDITIGSSSEREHIDAVGKVLNRCRERRLTLRLDKCHFGCRRVTTLGHDISEGRMRPSREHTGAISSFPIPRDAAGLLRFIGVARFFEAFVPGLSDRIRPLMDVFKGVRWKKMKWNEKVHVADFADKWTPECDASFVDIRSELSSPESLGVPVPGCSKRLVTDASAYAVGAAIFQQSGDDPEYGGWRPLGFASRKFTGAESRYNTTERECLAVVYGLRKFRYMLHGERFEIVTDHLALKWILSLSEPKGRLARWALEISAYGEFQMVYASGSSRMMVIPDALSRADCDPYDDDEVRVVTEEEPVVPSGLPSILEMRAAQEGDEKVQARQRDDDSVLMDEDGLVVVIGSHGRGRVLVPELLKEQILLHFHGGPSSGHYGVAKTVSRIGRLFTWPTIARDVRDFIKRSVVCGINRIARDRPPAAPLVPWHPRRRFETLAVDVLEITPPSPTGLTKVLVMIDIFTRFAWAVAIPDEKAETIAACILREWIARFGVPERLLTDNGKPFVSSLMRALCDKLGIQKIFTTPFHPQGNGSVERWNRTLLTDLRAMAGLTDNWDEVIPLACLRYNTTVHSATKLTPFQAMLGCEHPEWDPGCSLRYWEELLADDEDSLDTRLRRLHDAVLLRGGAARSAAAKAYDKAVRTVRFKVGDRVLVHHPSLETMTGRKLYGPWTGPYRITGRLGEVGYLLCAEQDGSETKVHVNRLRAFDETFVETCNPPAYRSIFPDTARLLRSIMGVRTVPAKDGAPAAREFQIKKAGRRGYIWVPEKDLPTVVVASYDFRRAASPENLHEP
jgi:transposase InsO family protein